MEDHRKLSRPRKGAGMKHHFNGKRKKEQQALWNANYRAKKRAEKLAERTTDSLVLCLAEPIPERRVDDCADDDSASAIGSKPLLALAFLPPPATRGNNGALSSFDEAAPDEGTQHVALLLDAAADGAADGAADDSAAAATSAPSSRDCDCALFADLLERADCGSRGSTSTCAGGVVALALLLLLGGFMRKRSDLGAASVICPVLVPLDSTLIIFSR